MTDALRLEVKKDQWRQNQGGDYKLTFTVNPTDLDDNAQDLLMDFFKAPMGAVYMLGAARVGDDGQPVKASPAAPEKRQRSDAEMAGIYCNDPKFQIWLEKTGRTTTAHPNNAAEYVRWFCGVKSRSEIGNNMAAVKWQSLKAEFDESVGRRAEMR